MPAGPSEFIGPLCKLKTALACSGPAESFYLRHGSWIRGHPKFRIGQASKTGNSVDLLFGIHNDWAGPILISDSD